MKSKDREEKILIAGFGGQGIMFLGRVLAQSAILEKKNLTYIRSYGAEMRGGTANCMVRIGRSQIGSPVFEKATLAIIMNRLSWEKFKNRIEKRGFALLNSSLIKKDSSSLGIRIKRVPLSDLALRVGSLKVANIIGIGAFLREEPIVKLSSVEAVLKEIFDNKPQLLKFNLQALKVGFNYHGKK